MNKPQFERNHDKRFEFFPGKRRQVVLEGITAQCNAKGDDRKIVFHVCMPLTGQPLIGFPGFLQPAWECAEKENSAVTQAKMNGFTLEGMKIEFFSQEDSKRHIAALDNRTLYDFMIEREAVADSYITLLRFKYRSQETVGAYGFWVKHGFNNIWADFIPTANAVKEGDDNQMTLGQETEEEEAETVDA